MHYTITDLLTGAKDMATSVFGKKSEYIISFTKESDGLWYVDYPNWPFDHHNLLMVAGADKLCELLSYDGKHTRVKVVPTDKRKDGVQNQDIDKEFELVQGEHGLTEGSHYSVGLNPFQSLGGRIWLCPVTLFVLGQYPKYMYVTKLNKETNN